MKVPLNMIKKSKTLGRFTANAFGFLFKQFESKKNVTEFCTELSEDYKVLSAMLLF